MVVAVVVVVVVVVVMVSLLWYSWSCVAGRGLHGRCRCRRGCCPWFCVSCYWSVVHVVVAIVVVEV